MDIRHREPAFNVPGVILALLAILFAVHAGLQLVSEADWTWWIFALAFVPARYAETAQPLPGGALAVWTSPVTHMFVHGDIVHLMVNSAWLLAFGSVLAKRLGLWRFGMFSVASGLAGALLFCLVNPQLLAPVIGASGAIAGMMGGVMRFLLHAIDNQDGMLLREDPASIERMSLNEALTDRRIVLSSFVFIVINLLAISGFGTFGAAGSIAWEAHIGGYAFGLLAFALFDVAPQNSRAPSTKTPYDVE